MDPPTDGDETMTRTWYRGDNGSGEGRWYAADRDYAEFFGSVSEIQLNDDDVLDLTDYGVGDEDTEVTETGMPEYRRGFEFEMFQYVERHDVREAAKAMGYRAIRVMQWHSEYSGEAQDTIILTD